MTTTYVPQAFVHRLNRASARKRYYPFDPAIIDWSVPLDDRHLYMPEELTFLHGSPVWERLAPRERSFVTRWEITQMMRNAGFGEHLLNLGALSLLWRIDQHDPAWRYLLHEVAEECQHMAMFNEWVVRNADIETFGVSDYAPLRRVLPRLSRVALRIAARRPELFWVYVLLFEAIGDDVFQRFAHAGEGEVHPILRQMGRVHVVEEARHIAFAISWLEESVPRLGRTRRRVLQDGAALGLSRIARMPRLFPLVYNRQIACLMTRSEFRAAVRSHEGRRYHADRVREIAERLAEVGAIRRSTLARYEE